MPNPQEPMNTDLYYRVSDLPIASPISGSEFVEAIQNGKNVRFTLSQLFSSGASAYDVAVENGYIGTQVEWLASLKGLDGLTGAAGANGKTALEVLKEAYPAEFGVYYMDDVGNMRRILTGDDGASGEDGKSALDVLKENFPEAFQNYYNTDEENMLALLKGQDGAAGRGVIEELQELYPHEFVVGDEESDQETMTRLLKGEKGDRGTLTRVVGEVENTDGLPDALEAEQAGHAYLIENNMYVPVAGEWINVGNLTGPEGMGLRILGTLDSIAGLPNDNNRAGDAYLINKKMYVWDSLRWGETGNVGAPGKSAYELSKDDGFEGTLSEWVYSLRGETGRTGAEGPRGLTGLPANAINVIGSLDSELQLPDEGGSGDAFFIGDNLWFWNGDVWSDAGVYAPESAYAVALRMGFEGSESEWLESLVGAAGEMGLQGPMGLNGTTGPGLKLLGTKSSVAALPATSENLGDAYLVDGTSWVYGTDGWFDAGVFRGEKGEKGDQGPQGIQGITGPQLVIVGEVASSAELPLAGDTAPGVAYAIGANVWIRGATNWFNAGALRGVQGERGLKGDRGPQGVQGETGPQGQRGQQGYRGEAGGVGERGVQGLQGPVGKQLVLMGRVSSQAELPISATVGDAWVINDSVWIWSISNTWVDTGILQGPQGIKGDSGTNGTNGVNGAVGSMGPQGPQGKALNLLGTKATVGELPPETAEGFSWMVGEVAYLKTSSGYVNIGTLQGPQGVQGPQGIKGDSGTNGTNGVNGERGAQGPALKLYGKLATPDLLPADMPEYGMSYVVGDRLYTYGVTGWSDMGFFGAVSAYDIAMALLPEASRVTEAVWVTSLKGDQGETGVSGADGIDGKSITIMGSFARADLLPVSGSAGDGYLVGMDLYVWAGSLWKNVGPVRGPDGQRGEVGPMGLQGKQGIQGARGIAGSRGPGLLLGDYDPGALEGSVGDTWTNTVTQGVWLKSTTTLWTFIGNFGGGNVYSPANDGTQYVRKGSQWVALSSPPDDGFQYVRVGADWVKLDSPPDDGFQYVRRGKNWARLNTYDLGPVVTTGVCDISTSNVFTLANSSAGIKTISFTNAPAGRAMTVVVLVSGKVGNVIWPVGIIWSDNAAPQLGALVTNVVLLWDGTRFIGSVAASA